MEESLIRELIRFQDTLHEYVDLNLWYEWAEINEKVIEYLRKEAEE